MDYLGTYKRCDICGEGKINGEQKFTVKNISASGIKIILKSCLNENEQFKMNFTVKSYFFEKHIITDGLVISHIPENDDHIYEIKFVSLSQHDIIQIDEVVNSFYTLPNPSCQSFYGRRSGRSKSSYWRRM